MTENSDIKNVMGVKKKVSQNINHQNSILFSHNQGGRSIFFVLDQYLDIKFYPKRVKGHHVGL